MSESPRETWEPIAKLFSIFAEKTRLSILHELVDGPRCVGELMTTIGTTQANISKQLQVLHQANLLTREKRGTQVYYTIKDGLVLELCQMAAELLRRSS